MKLRYTRIGEGAMQPQRKNPTDAGIDVYASETVVIPPFSAKKVPTGLSFEIRPEFMLLAKPKSGSDLLIGAGVIDPGYQGEILIKVVNYTPNEVTIKLGQPIAQLVQVRVLLDELEEVGGGLGALHTERSQRGADGGIVRQG